MLEKIKQLFVEYADDKVEDVELEIINILSIAINELNVDEKDKYLRASRKEFQKRVAERHSHKIKELDNPENTI